jgi:hypothetical protein
MSTVVLVHRAWHDGSAWIDVTKRLQHHRKIPGGHGRLFANPNGLADKMIAAGHR